MQQFRHKYAFYKVKTKNSGFTLVEMVATIVVMGIVSVSLTGIISLSMRSYVSATYRTEMVDNGRFMIQRLSRELRSALPGSVRVKTTGQVQCLEYVPIVAATTYRNNDLPIGTSSATFDAVDFNYVSDGDHYVAVATNSASAVYNASQDYRIGLDRVDPVDANNFRQVVLDSSHAFAEESPTRRLYIVDEPISFCLRGTQLYRYENYGYSNAQSTNPGTGVLLGENIQDNSSPFNYQAGTLTRNALVQFDLVVTRDDETVRFSHEVYLRNAM